MRYFTSKLIYSLLSTSNTPTHIAYYMFYLPASFSVTGADIVDIKDCATAPVE